MSPKNAKALFRRGQARAGQFEYASALKGEFCYVHALCVSPDYSYVDLNEAIRLEPKNDAVWQELKRVGDLLKAKGQKGKKVRAIENITL